MRQLTKVMRTEHIEIATKWFELGLELVDSYKTLKVIEADHPNDVNTCCRVMFEKWLEKTPDASWEQLVTALNSIKMNTAVVIVSKLLKSGKSLRKISVIHMCNGLTHSIDCVGRLCIG